ncbi:MAG TPA: glycerate kinase, partial [Planctomycetaceae bacterium]|nr:glycerate kinase [Planctomycetaceae bacterium]
VIGDPLDIIASGPVIADSGTDTMALKVLKKFAARIDDVPEVVWRCLEARAADEDGLDEVIPETVTNHVIGNNQVAVAAAIARAEALGYHVHSLGSE